MKSLLDKDDPILRQTAEPVEETEISSNWLKKLVKKMFSIMEENEGVGIAAPQIGVSKRIIAFGTNFTQRKIEEPIPNTVLINPALRILSKEIQIGYEGCLNCEDTMAKVPRAMEIEYSGIDMEGNTIVKKATGLEARILQHEIDHLNGFLFLDRVEDEESLTTLSELRMG